MNTSKLKSFAPEVRRQLMEAVERKLDYVLTADTADLRAMGTQVSSLRRQADRERDALVERVAYTWFNRLAALRFLDARGWHPFKARVLTPANADETQPEVLKLLRTGSLPEELRPHTDLARLNDLLDGRLPPAIAGADPQGEVYRHLILAACRFYHATMPFLFEELDDETELLLPDDLLTATSVAEGFRTEISDEDCSEVEILGWLYQFYISEKKDAVMARKKAVPSEDIPAVTQLFTPHWIVRYLVENSLGRLWLRSRPNSRLKGHMPYYVEEPEPNPNGIASSSPGLAASAYPGSNAPHPNNPNGVASEPSPTGRNPLGVENHAIPHPQGSASRATLGCETESLRDSALPLTVARPEDIRLLDPACGSGHMLTYAFDLLVKIYEEEGHAPSEIPEKILTHNLFGLEICPRAAQLAQFALVCKAREQSRTAFRRPVQPQVMCLRDVVLTPDEMQAWSAATGVKLSQDELAQVHQFREHTETFGSLIQPVLDGEKLAALVAKIGEQAPAGDLLVQNTHRKLRLVLDQAEMLSQRYQVVAANPPYMGSKGMNAELGAWTKKHYKPAKNDLMTCFMVRCEALLKPWGYWSMINLPSWMFLVTFEGFREDLLSSNTVNSLLHLGRGLFGSDFGTVAFSMRKSAPSEEATGTYRRLFEQHVQVRSPETIRSLFLNHSSGRFEFRQSDFGKIPTSPIVYWLPQPVVDMFTGASMKDHLDAKQGLGTGDNERFMRQWFEVPSSEIGFGFPDKIAAKTSGMKWFPINKGGAFRKWYGNQDFIINWQDDGREVKEYVDQQYPYLKGNIDFVIKDRGRFFHECISWSDVTSGSSSFRYYPKGFLYNLAGHSAFVDDEQKRKLGLSFANTNVCASIIPALNPTLHFNIGNFDQLPWPDRVRASDVESSVSQLVALARSDWNAFETSWDFSTLPLLSLDHRSETLEDSYATLRVHWQSMTDEMHRLEEENNRTFIAAYSLANELTPDVRIEEITLTCNPAYRYGVKGSEEDRETRLRAETIAAFLSYAVGCMMGRYSLDRPGLILADAGDTVENYLAKVGKPLHQIQFPPDDDAIIPLLDGEWFTDDVVARTREFLRVTFGDDTLEENLRFIEESLGKDLRKYFLTDFYKDHLQTYKKRPIYWLFQSPKKGFGALVYLHRYTRDTVNTLLNDYLRDFLKKLESRIEHLGHVQDTASSAREKTAATKEADRLRKTLKECREWERDILLPLAQQRLEIDLDDGVKANYPKFGKALAPIPGLAKNK